MGNSLRCCLACVLPCGALDVIRIVHLNGHMEEITRPITAGEALQNYPNHIISKPSSQGILILSPENELRRGSIYFLIPASTLPEKKKKRKVQKKSPTNVLTVPEKKSSGGVRKAGRGSGRVGVWRPHLESICED